MGNAVTSQTLLDGARNVVMQFTGVNDGSDPEVNVAKVAASSFVPPPRGTLKVKKVTYDVQGGILQLAWDAAVPVTFLQLEGYGEFDYKKVGGLINAGGDTATGDILFTMLGFDAGSSYSVKLEMVKKYRKPRTVELA